MPQADSAACRGAPDLPTGRLDVTSLSDERLIPERYFFWLNHGAPVTVREESYAVVLVVHALRRTGG